MKKNYFVLLCSMLLSISLLGTACSDDGSTPPTPEEPSFPAAVVKTATAGEIIELTFDANYDWTASVSESSYTYFQLLNGENTAKTIAGTKGQNNTIKVKVADVTVYDNAPSTEVTLTMNNQSKVIATITYPVTERTFEVYAPVYNEYGVFEGNYAEEAISEDDVLEMVYGAPAKGKDATLFVPVKLVSNFPFIVAGPEWMTAIEAGVVGENEVIVAVDPLKIPAASTEATIDILTDSESEEAVTSFKVSLTGADEFIAIDNVDEEGEVSELLIEYTYDAELTSNSLHLSARPITASESVVIKAIDEEGDEIAWFTVAADEWDAEGSTIQTRILVISDVKENNGAVREAYIYAMPEAVAADFDFESEEAAAYYVATVKQYAAPAVISTFVLDDTSTTFGEAVGVDYWFTEGALNELYIGNKYDISYFGEYAMYGSSSSFQTDVPIESFEYYAYNDFGFGKMSDDDSWVTGDIFFEDEESGVSRFSLLVDLSKESAAAAMNLNNGEYEAVVLVKYIDGTYSGIYFHYSEQSAVAGGDGVAVVEGYEGMLEDMGVFLQEVVEGDADYDYDYAYMGTAQYRLIFTQPGSCAPLVLPAGQVIPSVEWMMCEPTMDGYWIMPMPEEAGVSTPAKCTIQIMNMQSWSITTVIYCYCEY